MRGSARVKTTSTKRKLSDEIPSAMLLDSEDTHQVEQEAMELQKRLFQNTSMLTKAPSTIPGAGNGLFANQHIAKDTLLGFYVGKVIVPSAQDLLALPANSNSYRFRVYDQAAVDRFRTDDSQTVSAADRIYDIEADPADDKSLVHFANHTVDVDRFNAIFQQFPPMTIPEWNFVTRFTHVVLVAFRDIAADDEILTNYGSVDPFSRKKSKQERDTLSELVRQ